MKKRTTTRRTSVRVIPGVAVARVFGGRQNTGIVPPACWNDVNCDLTKRATIEDE